MTFLSLIVLTAARHSAEPLPSHKPWATCRVEYPAPPPVKKLAFYGPERLTPKRLALETLPRKASAAIPEPLPAEDTLCSLSVVGVDLARVLQILSAQAKVNLVLLSPQANKLTLQLNNVRFVDMLRHVCAISGLTYLKAGSAYVVATDSQLKASYRTEWQQANPAATEAAAPGPQPPVTKVVTLSYVSSGQAATALGKVYPSDQLTVVSGPIQDSPSIAAQQTGASTGKESIVLTKDQQGEGGKTLVLRGDSKVIEEAMAILRQIDVARPQVAIEVTIHDISDSALRELGLSWSFSDVQITESGNKGVNFGKFTRSPEIFSATVKALETANKAKLLASPNISVLDGERAFVLIGDRINFPVLVGYTQANTPIFDKQEERVGIYLQVAATVNAGDDVTLSLYPQVSTITGFLNVNGASYPQISTREAQTTIRVKSGEIVALAGLLRNEDLNQFEKVPILADLPILGELFKRRKRTHSQSQVVISIRPTVTRPQ